MGDLTFGESLGLLENTDYTPWVALIFLSLKFGTYMRALRLFPFFKITLHLWTPKGLQEKRQQHFQYASDRVTKRLEAKLQRPDIWGIVLRQQEQGHGLSLKEMHSNAALFMGAGTETTATELSGLLYLLLQNPSKMSRLVQQIRETFQTDEDITMDGSAKIDYLHACVEESLRLYPPVPIGLPRVAPAGGATICGDFIPGGYEVCITQYSTYRSSANFRNPNSFIPERWMSDPEYATDSKTALQPFSYGPRNCIGQNMAYHEIRLIITKLLWHYDFTLCKESESWIDMQKVYALWEKLPLLVKVKPVQR
jgi:cytochrome P450